MRFVRVILNGILSRFILIAALFVFAVAVDQITPLKQLDAYLRQHPQPYKGITLVLLGAGLALLLYAWGTAFIYKGRPADEEEAKAYMSGHVGPGWQGWQVGTFRGKAVMREAKLAASFSQVKEAFRTGQWLLDREWRPLCLGLLGLLLILPGAFGFFFVVSPPAVKVIVALALVYALARTAWGFWKA
jgi:hypothetical protein